MKVPSGFGGLSGVFGAFYDGFVKVAHPLPASGLGRAGCFWAHGKNFEMISRFAVLELCAACFSSSIAPIFEGEAHSREKLSPEA